MKIIYSKSRKERNINKKHGAVLTELITLFISSCLTKDEEVIKGNYKSFEDRWVSYVNKINQKENGVILFTDSFESCINKFYAKTKTMGNSVVQNDYKRIFNTLVEEPTFLQKVKTFLFNRWVAT